MGIGLTRSRFLGDLRVCAVAFDADRRVGLLGRRTFRVARGTLEAGRDVLVDEKVVSSARRRGRRRHLSGCVGRKTCSKAAEHCQRKKPRSSHRLTLKVDQQGTYCRNIHSPVAGIL